MRVHSGKPPLFFFFFYHHNKMEKASQTTNQNVLTDNEMALFKRLLKRYDKEKPTCAKRSREYYYKHKAQISAKRKLYYQNNKHKFKQYYAERKKFNESKKCLTPTNHTLTHGPEMSSTEMSQTTNAC